MPTKLLCLHGYTQNGPLFAKRIAVLRKQLAKHNIECIFPSGPFKATETSEEDEQSWWNHQNNIYVGMKESISILIKFVDENGPVNGIIGFSQGAAMTSILANSLKIKPDYIIVVGGFLPRDLDAVELITFTGPQLHVMGAKDELVTVETSKNLVNHMARFNAASDIHLFEHDGGHFVPGKAEARNFMVDWILNNSGTPKQKL
jgi:predicted esterase